MKKIVGIFVAVLLALTACSDSGVAPERVDDPTGIVKVSGDEQSGVGGDTLGEPFVVATRGVIGGAPREGVTVVWTVVSGSGGSMSSVRSTTDRNGRTSVFGVLPNLEDAGLRVEASPSAPARCPRTGAARRR